MCDMSRKHVEEKKKMSKLIWCVWTAVDMWGEKNLQMCASSSCMCWKICAYIKGQIARWSVTKKKLKWQKNHHYSSWWGYSRLDTDGRAGLSAAVAVHIQATRERYYPLNEGDRACFSVRRIKFCLEKSKTNALITQQKLLITCGSIAFVFRILKIKLDVVSLLFFIAEY